MRQLSGAYPIGSWGDETREYHVAIRTPPHEAGDIMLAGRVSVVVGDEKRAETQIRAIWTNDRVQATRVNRVVAHFTGQDELARAIQEGLEARKAGDDETAIIRFGRAVQLAAASGNDGTLKLLAGVVDIGDAATGTVRLKRSISTLDEMTLDTRSTKTVRVPNAVR